MESCARNVGERQKPSWPISVVYSWESRQPEIVDVSPKSSAEMGNHDDGE